MKYKYIVIVLVFLTIKLEAQIFMNDDPVFCPHNESKIKLNNKPWYANNQFLDDYLLKIDYDKLVIDNAKILYRVPITFWVYRDSKGRGGPSDMDIRRYMLGLNKHNIKNNTGFAYYVREIKYIDKNKRTKFGYHLEAPLVTTFNRSSGSIDVHVVNNLFKPGKKHRDLNYKGTYNKVNRAVIVSRRIGSTVLPHEIGHYFGLLHPHEGYTCGKRKQEPVSRTRKRGGLFHRGVLCEINGDKLCDTPAEPRLSKYVNRNCKFTGSDLKDNWGDTYQPNTKNIMSYPTYKTCRAIFTKGQIAVMLYTAAKDKHAEAWQTKPNKSDKYKRQYDFDKFEPDNTIKMASSIVYDSRQYHTFHKIYWGKNITDTDEDVDWFRFSIPKKNRRLKLIVEPALYKSPVLKITIYNKNHKQLAQAETNSQNNSILLELGSYQKGNYYIKIEKLNKIKSPDIADYYIEIKD